MDEPRRFGVSPTSRSRTSGRHLEDSSMFTNPCWAGIGSVRDILAPATRRRAISLVFQPPLHLGIIPNGPLKSNMDMLSMISRPLPSVPDSMNLGIFLIQIMDFVSSAGRSTHHVFVSPSLPSMDAMWIYRGVVPSCRHREAFRCPSLSSPSSGADVLGRGHRSLV